MMPALPEPCAGLVIRYAYLWRAEYERDQEESANDRPCAVILVTRTAEDGVKVSVLPITHSQPNAPDEAVRLPEATCARLGFDSEPQWIVLSEANRFMWPGPDLRFGAHDDPRRLDYGVLPRRFFNTVRDRFLELASKRRPPITKRTD